MSKRYNQPPTAGEMARDLEAEGDTSGLDVVEAKDRTIFIDWVEADGRRYHVARMSGSTTCNPGDRTRIEAMARLFAAAPELLAAAKAMSVARATAFRTEEEKVRALLRAGTALRSAIKAAEVPK